MQSSTRLIDEKLHCNQEVKETITRELQGYLLSPIVDLVNSYLMPISHEVQRLYLRKQPESKETAAYDEQIADYCLECLFKNEPNGVANALTELSPADQAVLLQAWEKRKADHSKYALLIGYYQHTNELKNNINDLTTRIAEVADNALIPSSLTHALKIKIAVANNEKDRFHELLAEASLHINLKGAHLVDHYFAKESDPRLLNWQGFNLEEITTHSCAFYDVDFTGAHFKNADLRGARFLYGCVIKDSDMSQTKNLIFAHDCCDRHDIFLEDIAKAGGISTVIDGEFNREYPHAVFRVSNGSLLHYHYEERDKQRSKARFLFFSWEYEEIITLRYNPNKYSDRDRVNNLSNCGVDINRTNQAGDKPIILAAQYRDKEGFHILLRHPTAIITHDDLQRLKKIRSDETKKLWETTLKCWAALASSISIAIGLFYLYAALIPLFIATQSLILALIATVVLPTLMLVAVQTLALLPYAIILPPKACLNTYEFDRDYYQPALTQSQTAAKKSTRDKSPLAQIQTQDSTVNQRHTVCCGRLFQHAPRIAAPTTPLPATRRLSIH